MTHSLPPKSLVLYADDDPDDIDLVKDAFQSYTVNTHLLTFSNGIELLNYIENLDPLQPLPCLFIIDINMPRLNGKETLMRLRKMQHFNEIPAVLFSTSTMPADAHFAQKFKAGFVTKPLMTDQIYQIIDQIIEHCSEEVKNRIKKK